MIATGRLATVRDFLDLAFGAVGLNWQEHVQTSSDQFRAADVQSLVGDSSKARRVLGWQPATDLSQLVRMMVDSDLESLRQRSDVLSTSA